MTNLKQNKQNKNNALRCAVCGDTADYSAGVDREGFPILGICDNKTFGGMGPCGDLHRWVPAHKDAV